jgi:hypothetical protein
LDNAQENDSHALSYSILPMAIILGAKGTDFPIEDAKELLNTEPNVRKALQGATCCQ